MSSTHCFSDYFRRIFLANFDCEIYIDRSFSQELPSRALKMVLKATDENKDGLISVEEVENLLERIKVSDKMTKAEITSAMESLGLDEGIGVPMKKIEDLFLRK